jgi:Asp-tRNA(Asn)/Glu-tRNA(Gln) amidotransferase B subunit
LQSYHDIQPADSDQAAENLESTGPRDPYAQSQAHHRLYNYVNKHAQQLVNENSLRRYVFLSCTGKGQDNSVAIVWASSVPLMAVDEEGLTSLRLVTRHRFRGRLGTVAADNSAELLTPAMVAQLLDMCRAGAISEASYQEVRCALLKGATSDTAAAAQAAEGYSALEKAAQTRRPAGKQAPTVSRSSGRKRDPGSTRSMLSLSEGPTGEIGSADERQP